MEINLLFYVILIVGFKIGYCQRCDFDFVDEECKDEVDTYGVQFESIGFGISILQNDEYPYMVSLQKQLIAPLSPFAPGCYQHICGGTMISPKHILTAAHCFQGVDLVGPRNEWPSETIYAAISPKCRHLQNENFGRLQVATVQIHPSYNTSSKEGDIAVVEVIGSYTGEVVQFANQTSPDLKQDDIVKILGYGVARPEEEQLLVVYPLHGGTLFIISDDICNAKMVQVNENLKYFLNFTTMLCAYSDIADTCEGDSGGPLLYNGVQYGIVSWGPASQCQSLTGVQFPSVFTKVSQYSDWINQIISEVPPNPIPPPVIIPSPVPTSMPAPVPTVTPTGMQCSGQYEVQFGDTLLVISQNLGVGLQDILDANPSIDPNFVFAGQIIKIPPCDLQETTSGITNPNCGGVYIVKAGDLFFKVALSLGVTQQQLKQLNPQITNINALSIGQQINKPPC